MTGAGEGTGRRDAPPVVGGPGLGWIPWAKVTAPDVADGVVVRDDLRRALARSLDTNRLTLVVAQGGSGKTTLVAAVTSDLDVPVAWARLHVTDDDPRALVEVVVTAVERAVPGACPFTLEVLRSGPTQALPLPQVLGVLTNELGVLGPLVLVLDDLHVVTGPSTLEALAYLLEFAPPGLHVVATCRRRPDLPLSRLAATAGVGALDAADLQLDRATGADLLARRGLTPTPEEVDGLLAASNGWLTGFLLAARAGPSPAGPGGVGPARPASLDEYLAEEVVGAEPPRTGRFLRQVSLLGDLDPGRCAAVTGVDDAAAIIDDLHRRLGFLLVEEGGRLRLHDLFATHLRAELERSTTPAERAELHRRAAATARGPVERVEHLVAAGDQHRVAEVLDEMAHAADGTPWLDRQLVTWIGQVDEEVRAGWPWLDLVVGTALGLERRGDEADRVLRSVVDRARAADDYELACLATMAWFEVTHDFGRGQAELAQLEADPRFGTLPDAVRVEWLMAAAWGALWSRRLDQVPERAAAAMAVVRAGEDRRAAQVLVLHLGFPLAVWPGALDELAEYHAWASRRFGASSWVVRLGATAELEALALLRGRPAAGGGQLTATEAAAALEVPHFAVTAAFVGGAKAAAVGDHVGVRQALLPVIEEGGGGFGLVLAPLLAASARRSAHHDDLDAVRAAVAGWAGGPPGDPVMGVVRGFVEAEAAWAGGDLDGAAAGFADLEEKAPLVVAPLLDLGCELALVRAEQGRAVEARAGLAARLAHLVGRLQGPGRVALAGPDLVPLLEDLAGGADAVAGGQAAEVLDVLRRPAEAAPRRVPGTGEVLTAREVEVLALLASGASNAEVAGALYVSVNTVKTHVKRVLAKLGASSRAEAVAVARRQHLL